VSTPAEQLDIFSERGRDEGMSRALSTVDAQLWVVKANAAIQSLAEAGTAFTIQDVIREAGMAPSSGAAGAVLRNAQNAGLIRLIGYTKSSRVSRHANRIGLWRASA
jgi:hypothetical protein